MKNMRVIFSVFVRICVCICNFFGWRDEVQKKIFYEILWILWIDDFILWIDEKILKILKIFINPISLYPPIIAASLRWLSCMTLILNYSKSISFNLFKMNYFNSAVLYWLEEQLIKIDLNTKWPFWTSLCGAVEFYNHLFRVWFLAFRANLSIFLDF